MDKDFILAEIKRTAEQNGGVPLGRERFAKHTGIKTTDWYGKHWSRWGDALTEAGYIPNEFQLPYDERHLLKPLALLVRELGRFPVHGELRIKARQDKTFPSHSVFAKLGSKVQRARKILDYCAETPGFDDVAVTCRSIVAEGRKEAAQKAESGAEIPFGFVYLARMGKILQDWAYGLAWTPRIRTCDPVAGKADTDSLNPHRRSRWNRGLLAQAL